jgi:hypothetical protein
MADERKSRIESEIESLAEGKFTGEEGGDINSTPGKNLGGAVVIGALAIYAMAMSLTFDSPGSLFTAPGLLPFLTGATLLIMCIFLGIKGVREGGAEGWIGAPIRALQTFIADDEGRRGMMLMGIVFLYILLVGLIDFELEWRTQILDFKLSSYEVISFVMITWILKIFWQKPVVQCFIVSFLMVEALASTFRYGFSILMPAAG